jgi:hypothetical protein
MKKSAAAVSGGRQIPPRLSKGGRPQGPTTRANYKRQALEGRSSPRLIFRRYCQKVGRVHRRGAPRVRSGRRRAGPASTAVADVTEGYAFLEVHSSVAKCVHPQSAHSML